ncbi:uncharacterized protein RB166_004111 [Leptodactylus fuscus]|uniref:uncharacterized protein LOC142197326 n=1 Tax=Leptodactylus fuscus TaxID=238119 RepID=UPI003F4F29C3
MVPSLSLLAFLVSLPLTYGDEHSEAICSIDACYTVHLSREKHFDAIKECDKNGGILLTIQNEEEVGHVYTLLKKFTETGRISRALKLWIGLHRKGKSCVDENQVLRGFSWVNKTQDAKEGQFSNWLTEPKKSCTKEMCVNMKLHMDSPDNYKWSDESCSARADGYICKFTFQGMCQRVALAGPGRVEYNTPFSFKSSSLDLVPHGSWASVSCDNGDSRETVLVCRKSEESNVYLWSNFRSDKLGPFCASEELGCKYNNGGCDHECVEHPQNKSFSCRCRDGYVLAPDLVSCVYPDHCQLNPCEQKCINHQYGYECSCTSGFELTEDKVTCKDINECLDGRCSQTCINTLGSFYCKCNTGFQQQGTDCIDIDECINSICSQSCLNIPGSYLCSCNNGYTISSDNTTCLDVDECAQSPCAHYCNNTYGSYYCSCPKGMLLSPDHISCIHVQQNSEVFTSGDINEGLDPAESTSGITNQPTPMFTESTMDIQDDGETEQIMQSTPMPQDTGTFSGNSSVNLVQSSHEDSRNVVLLVSVLCACAVLLLLIVIIVGVLCHRKRNTKKNETEKQQSATDNYCWVPDQKGDKAVNNDYR